MVYRKRKFTEVDGARLLEATEVFGDALHRAHSNAPFGSEIFKAIEQLWQSVRHVQITLTGDPDYGEGAALRRHLSAPGRGAQQRIFWRVHAPCDALPRPEPGGKAQA